MRADGHALVRIHHSPDASAPALSVPPVSTHIGAAAGDIAPLVLMPGDPLRAKWIAETFLDDARCYSEVRGMYGFTGTWHGHPVSVQGSWHGAALGRDLCDRAVPGVRRRVDHPGRLGRRALRPLEAPRHRDRLRRLHRLGMNRVRFEGLDYAPVADFGLLRAAVDAAGDRSGVHVGLIFSGDSFYPARPELMTRMVEHGVLAIEMEASALYTIAAGHGRRALAICTVSDHIVTGEETSSEERERTFGDMVEIALAAGLG